MTDKADAAAAARTLVTTTSNIRDAITEHNQADHDRPPLSTGLNPHTSTPITKKLASDVLRGEATL